MTDAQTIDRPDLTALLARVQAAEEYPDRRGYDVLVALLGKDRGHAFLYTGPGNPAASLDAALALCERVLPGWTIRADIRAEVSDFGVEPAWDETVFPQKIAYWDAKAKTPALALVAALLKAKIAETQS